MYRFFRHRLPYLKRASHLQKGSTSDMQNSYDQPFFACVGIGFNYIEKSFSHFHPPNPGRIFLKQFLYQLLDTFAAQILLCNYTNQALPIKLSHSKITTQILPLKLHQSNFTKNLLDMFRNRFVRHLSVHLI